MSADWSIPKLGCSALGCTDPAAHRVRLDDGRERVVCEDCADGHRVDEVIADV